MAAFGCFMSLLELPWHVSLTYFSAGALVAATCWGCALSSTIKPGPAGAWRSAVRGAVAAGAWGGAATLAFVAILLSVAALALFLALLVVLTSPPIVQRVTALQKQRQILRSGASSNAASPERPSDVDSLRALLESASDQALASAWKESYWTLCEARTLAATLIAVETRRRCLDEWERREPGRFHAWLAAEPRPTSTWRTRPLPHETNLDPTRGPDEPPARRSD